MLQMIYEIIKIVVSIKLAILFEETVACNSRSSIYTKEENDIR